MRLEGQVAVITGAGSGIGRATARLFANEGARVVAADINSEGGKATVEKLQAAGGEGHFIQTDVRVEGEMEALFAAAEEKYGRVSIVFNNAGRMLRGTVLDITAAELTDLLALNLVGVFLGCRHGIPALRRNGGGTIVNTASAVAFIGTPNAAAYCASKAAVLQLTKAVALDVAKENIRVNAVCPGLVDTDFYAADYKAGRDPDEFKAASGARAPMGRMATAEEIAQAVLYLASGESSFCTGSALLVDGGITAQ